MEKIEYLLPAVGLKKKEWDDILQPVIINILHALNTNKHFPRKLIFGPEKYQGLGLTHPYDIQMITQMTNFISEGNHGSISGKIMDSTVEQFLVELGTEQGLQTTNELGQHWTTTSWIKDMWLYAVKHQFKIHQPYDIKPLRLHDVFLMDIFSTLSFNNKDLYLLNEVRMTMEAVTIADITDAAGTAIMNDCFNAVKKSSTRKLVWPRQRQITPELKKLWQNALTAGFLESSTSLKLRTKLGQWIQTPIWHEWWSREENRLMIRDDNKWRIWIPIPTRSRQQKFQPTDERVEEPAGAPISTYKLRSYKCIQSKSVFPEQTSPNTGSLEDNIKNLPIQINGQ